jgi:hypothetical protein
MSIIDLNIFETEPAEIYHSRSKEFLSSHQLIEFMQCPYLYQKRRAGLITEKGNVPLHRITSVCSAM